MMKGKILVVLGLVLLLAAVFAQEPARFNFGTMQPTRGVVIEPGTEAVETLYFYNIYGNRVTHVRLIVSEAPGSWDVSFEPGAAVQTFEVSGQEVDSLENVFVEPTETVAERPDPAPEGMTYLKTGGIDGWIPAKVVKVKIRVPEDAGLGRYRVRVDATANWFGTQGVVVSKQARSFDYDVQVALGEYSERLLARRSLVAQFSNLVSPLVKYIPYISVALVVLMAVGLYVLNQKVEEAREMTAILKAMKKRKEARAGKARGTRKSKTSRRKKR